MTMTANLSHLASHWSLRETRERYDALSRQLTDGRKMQRASDDPVRFEQGQALQQRESELKQYQANIDGALSRLTSQEDHMKALQAGLERTDKLLRALTDMGQTGQPSDLAIQLQGEVQGLFRALNVVDHHSRYVFSGDDGRRPLVAHDASQAAGARYQFQSGLPSSTVAISDGVQEMGSVKLESGWADLLNHIERIANTLASHPQGASRVDIDNVRHHLKVQQQDLHGKLGLMGAAGDRLERMKTTHQETLEGLQHLREKIENVDVVDVWEAWQKSQNALERGRQVTARISQLSLFDVVR